MRQEHHPDKRAENDNGTAISTSRNSFGQRHGVTIMTVILATLFVLVIFVQVAC